MTKTVSYSKARESLASLLDEAEDSLEPIVVERRGHRPVAMIDAGELSALMEALHLFGNPVNARRLMSAMQSEGELMTLDEFFRRNA
jgi:antitoxin YefM